MSNPNYSTLITTTLQKHGKEIFDNVITNNALAYQLKQAGNIKIVDGGRTFTHPLIYGTNSSFKAYAKNAVIETPTTDLATRAEFPVRVLAGSIVLNKIDLAMNAGNKEKLIDLAEEKKLEAEISMGELMGDQVFSAGAGDDFDGLQYLINSAPSAQTDVGGIDSSASGNAYWRNQVNSSGIAAFNTSLAGVLAMNGMLRDCTFGTQGPRSIFTTKAVYGLYQAGLTSNIRYMDLKSGDAGFKALEFSGLPVMFDDNVPTGYMYFVDTNSLWLQVLAQANMQVTQFEPETDQLSETALMYIAGNLTTGSRRTNGVITGITG